jgi:DNA polymerase-3 subunit delta'
VRPESKSRIVSVEQMRGLMQEINLKPTEAEYKVAVIVAADRLNVQGANAFLKTLEEPPPRSVLILLTTEPQRLLETIVSRCLRLNFSGDGPRPLASAEMEWLASFSDMAAVEQKSLLGRYRLMDVLLQKLTAMKSAIEESLTARSPLRRYDDVEKDLREKWEDELEAAIEAEYRRQRTDLLAILQRWLRDVWLTALAGGRGSSRLRDASARQGVEGKTNGTGELLNFPKLAGTKRVASRISAKAAVENLQIIEATQRLLHTNVQEALAIEVGLLKLNL